MNSEHLLHLIENKYESELSNFTILQIGANDGVQDDLIRPLITKYNLKSHLVEPIKEHYQNLCSNYVDFTNVKCHNLAISDIDGEKIMTTIEYDESLPIWCKGLSTFDITRNFLSGFGGYQLKDDLRNSELFNKIKNSRTEIVVSTKTLDTFLSENKIDSIDVFVTDAEGHDFIIFNQLDFSKYSPKFIILETHTLSQRDKNVIVKKLVDNGYDILESSWDTVAEKK
jgi:hypothetical protein